MSSTARAAFEKLGDTRFSLGTFEIENRESCFVPVSQLNALRREMTAELERELENNLQQRLNRIRSDVLVPAPISLNHTTHSAACSIKVDRIAFLDEFTHSDFDQ